MSDRTLSGASETSPANAGDRLESWKVIATYLGRSVRTVRRWEESEGLPVHRHRHDKGSTVFAVRSELDAWREERLTASPATGTGPERGNGAGSAARAGVATAPVTQTSLAEGAALGRRWALAASLVMAAALGSILLGGLWWAEEVQPAAPAPGAHPHWVLIAGTQNLTGDERLDGALEHALQRAISNSRRLEVVPGDHVERILSLMRAAPDAALDRNLAEEVALRDERVSALVSGRAERLGREYLLSAEVLDPAGASTVASLLEQSSGEEDLAAAVRRLADRVRDALDHELPSHVPLDPSLKMVTTSSLWALRLFTRADTLMDEGLFAAAEELLSQALLEDPEFASAHSHLALAIWRRGGAQGEFRPPARRGFELADRTAESERLFIQGLYYHLLGERERAAASYEALFSLEPEHYWGNRNALALCLEGDWDDRCVPYQVKLADLKPDDFTENYRAAWALTVWARSPQRADRYLERARRGLDPDTVERSPQESIQSEFFTSYRGWLDGDLTRPLAEVARIADGLPDWPPETRDLVALELGHLELTLGRLEASEAWFRRISDPSLRHEMLALVLFARDDMDGLRRHLLEGSVYREPMTAVLMTAVGLVDQARALADEIERRGAPWPHVEILRGWLAFTDGREQEAMERLRRGTDASRVTADRLFFAGSDRLAAALRDRGDLRQAIGVLEMTTRQKSQAAFVGASLLWMKCEFALADLYREIGRLHDAGEIEASLLALLQHADADHPMRQELERRRATTA